MIRIAMTIPLILALAWGALFSALALAVPRLTDKDTALQIARLLDKGVFRGNLISSTFVQSPEAGKYLIKVVLDNGTELNWNLEQIRLWSQDDSLTLSRNKVLIFPDKEASEFGVLDKNDFARLALRSEVFAKHFKGNDLLAGQVIQYAIHRFNLVNLMELATRTDSQGYQYRYVLDLENGQREFLSYLDAWLALRKNAFQESAATAGPAPVMRTPYRLESLRFVPLVRIVEEAIGLFSLEMRFDRPIRLEARHFPFRFYEQKPGKGRAALDNNFVFEVTMPNTILGKPLKRIEAAEYLYRIHVVNDERHQNRVLLRAMITPEVLTEPPRITVDGNRVVVRFVKMDDISVFDRRALREAELQRRQEKLLAPALTAEDVKRRGLYRRHMETGLGQLDKARALKQKNDKFETLLASLANFREAAIHASSDRELEEALRQRNQLIARLPKRVMEYSAGFIGAPPNRERERVLALVRAMIHLIQDRRTLTALRKLESRLRK